jgi:hypothetical protein
VRLKAASRPIQDQTPFVGQRWEYQAVQIRKGTGDFEKMNAFGREGWECVGFDPSMVAWFKRPLS